MDDVLLSFPQFFYIFPSSQSWCTQGHHGDTSRMFYVGNVSPEAQRLCETTERALHAAIAECKPGMPIKVIGDVIQVRCMHFMMANGTNNSRDM